MKQLKYDFLPVKKIIVPFPIESESLKKQPDLRAYYKYFFPYKAEFLSNKNPLIIAISLLPEAPFGPDPEVLLDFLFKDFKKAILKVLHTFSLEQLQIIGLPLRRRYEQEKVSFLRSANSETDSAAILNLLEFKQLYTASSQRLVEKAGIAQYIPRFSQDILSLPAQRDNSEKSIQPCGRDC